LVRMVMERRIKKSANPKDQKEGKINLPRMKFTQKNNKGLKNNGSKKW